MWGWVVCTSFGYSNLGDRGRAEFDPQSEGTPWMGVVECVKHGLFIEYPVLYEKSEEFVAQFKFTAMVLPSGKVVRITSGPQPSVSSE